ncbi:MAG: SpoIIE family protein phosphatase [Desulfobacterales bacterium]|nr:SpoIIE family protein phosphatase [Desulfobacterales bacterium]
MTIRCDQREFVAVSHAKGTKHKVYEDNFRMLPRDIPLVMEKKRGELFAVFDGIGSAPKGQHAAQVMADKLISFYREPDIYNSSFEGINTLLMEANQEIWNWGFIPGTDRPLGGCAGTIVWLFEENIYVFHAGDTAGFLIRDDKLIHLTRTHQMENGAIIQYFGYGENLVIDIERFSIEELDRILLVSDGVTKVFGSAEAANIIGENPNICKAVIELARRSQLRGSTDDITAMLIEVEEIWD